VVKEEREDTIIIIMNKTVVIEEEEEEVEEEAEEEEEEIMAKIDRENMIKINKKLRVRKQDKEDNIIIVKIEMIDKTEEEDIETKEVVLEVKEEINKMDKEVKDKKESTRINKLEVFRITKNKHKLNYLKINKVIFNYISGQYSKK